MPIINRAAIIDQIRPYYTDGLIKVITGLRRTGKSTLLGLIAADMQLHLNRPKNSFLQLNFEDFGLRNLKNAQALHEYIEAFVSRTPNRATVMLDEIQTVEDWEDCINSLRARNLCDIFITGSNSKLLSGELATHLAGRTLQFEVFPFSFAEFRDSRLLIDSAEPLSKTWQDFLTWGGMPGLSLYPNLEAGRLYLRDAFESIVLRDVAQRCGIRQSAVLEELFAYLLEQAGHRISAASIEKYLKSQKISLSRDALLDYIKAGIDAFVFHRLESTDAKGKRIFVFQPKMYACDHGFREALFAGSNALNIDQVLENIVCIELKRRGWSLQTGDEDGKEIDFVAEKGGSRLYVQVCYLLAGEETFKREFEPLARVQDNYPKLVLSLDPIARPYKGIDHQNLVEFLLKSE